MKKLLFVSCALLLVVPAFALQSGESKWELAYEGEGYSYREPHMDYPISLKGQHHGASLKYTQQGVGGTPQGFGVVEGRLLFGDTKYDGYLMDGTPSTSKGITNWYFELRGLYGWEIGRQDGLRFGPYIGAGYRFLSNHMDEDPEGGYRRESTYFYIPLGVDVSFGDESKFLVVLNGEFDWMVYGNQRSDLSPYGYGKIDNRQEKGFGLRTGLKMEQNFGTFGVFIEPFYRFWKIQNSQVSDGFVEPFNISREYGAKIGVRF